MATCSPRARCSRTLLCRNLEGDQSQGLGGLSDGGRARQGGCGRGAGERRGGSALVGAARQIAEYIHAVCSHGRAVLVAVPLPQRVRLIQHVQHAVPEGALCAPRLKGLRSVQRRAA